jgi:HAD superfamily hydrolase (TIGR01490 family)
LIAFFDLDRTLVDVNSAKLWIRRELREGYISKRQALKAAGWVVLYEMGFADIEDVIERAMGTLAGEDEAPVVERTSRFWHEEVRARIRPGARDAVEAHRAKGERVVLLTSSSNYLSIEAQEELGLDDILCNRFEVVDGVFTGTPQRPLCFGPGKVTHAEAYAAQHGVALADCAFYTDSFSDLPMLEAVGKPVVVAPDPRLRRHARRRAWTIAEWGEAG